MSGVARLDLAKLELPRRVHACVAGDWLVFLDLTRDRYFALSALESLDAVREKVRSKFEPQAAVAASSARPGWLDETLAHLPDAILIGEAAWWARRLVGRGRLDMAFAWIERQKSTRRSLKAPRLQAADAHSHFERIRAWIPHRYVCLFNALTLIRYLLRRGFDADLVFGARGMPFAAHCWVEADGLILDPGEEDCGAFTEIVRV